MSVNNHITPFAFWVILGLFVALCGWLVYKLIDQSVTVDHFSQHLELVQAQRDLLLTVAQQSAVGAPETEIRRILETASSDNSVFEKGQGQLVAEQISFIFEDGKLLRINMK